MQTRPAGLFATFLSKILSLSKNLSLYLTTSSALLGQDFVRPGLPGILSNILARLSSQTPTELRVLLEPAQAIDPGVDIIARQQQGVAIVQNLLQAPAGRSR